MDLNIIRESVNIKTVNPFEVEGIDVASEATKADFKIKSLRAVYPSIRAINSEKLTRNFTVYGESTLKGKKNRLDPTGYSSYVWPHGKPVITEHNLQGDYFNKADSPLGRIIWSNYKKHGSDMIIPCEGGLPGFVEGKGSMQFVCAISDEDAIEKVLGGAFQTVSISSTIEKVIESISGQDIRALYNQGKELPPYSKGKWYDIEGKGSVLSYWSMMGQMRGLEVSFVNMPSDTHAFVEDPDIGMEALQLLLGEKRVGQESFGFYDAKTHELIFELSADEASAFDPNIKLIDSVKLPEYFLFDNPLSKEEVEEAPEVVDGAVASESVEKPTFKELEEVIAKSVKEAAHAKATTRISQDDLFYIEFEDRKWVPVSENDVSVTFRQITDSGAKTLKVKTLDKESAKALLDTHQVLPISSLKIEIADFSVPYDTLSEKDVDSLNVEKLKTFLNENFVPSKRYTEGSKMEALLELRQKQDWVAADVELAWNFKKVFTVSTCTTERSLWGAKEKELSKLDQLIENVLKGN
jgi:hypothetical protein